MNFALIFATIMAIIPALIVFDLDLTLWNFTFDADMTAPFSKEEDGFIYDSAGRKVQYFPEVPDILALAHKHDIKLAVISRSFKFPAVHQLLETLDWKKYLSYDVIHSGGVKALLKEMALRCVFLQSLLQHAIYDVGHSRTQARWLCSNMRQLIQSVLKFSHVGWLQHITKIRYPDMLFFDDSFYNIRQARSCDIVGVQVPNGMTPDDLKRGFDQFIRHKGGLSLSVEADRYSRVTSPGTTKQMTTEVETDPSEGPGGETDADD